MDACGCSNLICGTNTLFYDHLRDTRGVGNFFRYADTYLFGVGCEPGDFNQLDVWPLHKFVSILQPTAEAVLETINDRRITHLAIPETGARCRGEVVLSTWNAFNELGALRRHLLAAQRQARAAPTSRWSATASSRATSSRRSSPRPASTPASRRACGGCAATSTARSMQLRRGVPHAARPGRRPRAAGRDEVLPPGHQELTRRATPTVIIAGRGADAAVRRRVAGPGRRERRRR